LHPPSPLKCIEYNSKDSNFLVGGMTHGSLSLWDIRQGSLPVWTSAIEKSHHDAVSSVKWISSKTAFECVSVSADGTAMTWDTRSNTEPIESISLTPSPEMIPEGFTGPFGGCSLDYHTGVPTKYMVGTVEGLVLTVNRKSSDPNNRISGVFPGHYGPVYAVRRHPTDTKYFCSVSDWCCRFFTEDNKTPLLTIPQQRHYLTNAVWGLSRTSVVYTGNAVGGIDAWDLIQSLKEPVCSINVGSCPVYSMAIESNGQFLLTGDADGTATLLELNEPLRNISASERSLFNGMMSREAKRVKNYDQYLKEQKMREKAKAAGSQEDQYKKNEKPFDQDSLDKEFDAALRGEIETVVEKKRIVIGAEDDQAQPSQTTQQSNETEKPTEVDNQQKETKTDEDQNPKQDDNKDDNQKQDDNKDDNQKQDDNQDNDQKQDDNQKQDDDKKEEDQLEDVQFEDDEQDKKETNEEGNLDAGDVDQKDNNDQKQDRRKVVLGKLGR